MFCISQILHLQRNMNTLLTLWFLLSSAVCLHGLTVGDVTEVYRWVSVDYDWPNATTKTDYITNNLFILENNIIAGIKVRRVSVFFLVPFVTFRLSLSLLCRSVSSLVPTQSLNQDKPVSVDDKAFTDFHTFHRCKELLMMMMTTTVVAVVVVVYSCLLLMPAATCLCVSRCTGTKCT